MGLNLARLLKSYCDRHRKVPNTGNCLRKEFCTGRGVTQGDPAYPMIFNIVVDVVLRKVIDVVCRYQEAQNGLGWAAGDRNVFFYANDGRIVGRDH